MNQLSPPRWVTPLYIAALAAALAVLGTILFMGISRNPWPLDGDIADVTINLGGTPVREHCTSCHPEGSTATGSPHPDIAPHETAELGCTGCHLGEGMALDLVVSHGLPGNGARAILKKKDIQASCYRCHPLQPLAGAEKAWNGYRLYLQKGCDSCHPLAGLQQSGRYAPDLTAVGDHLGIDQLVTAIREPGREPVNSTMPRYPLSKRQARNIALFLKSRTARPLFQTPLAQLQKKSLLQPDDLFPGSEQLSPGQALLQRKRCIACHRYNRDDGRIGPDLSYSGLLRTGTYLADFPGDPTALIGGARMPAIRLTAAEQRLLVTELRQNADRLQQTRLTKAVEGRDLYMLLCQRCHAADGNGLGPIAANLAQMPRAFANNRNFFAGKSDKELQQSLAQGIPGTSMPGFARLLSPERREMLLDLLFKAFIGGGRYAKRRLPELPPKPEFALPAAAGQQLFQQYCIRCHGRSGTGRGPDAARLRLQPSPRNLTNTGYIVSRSDNQLLRAITYGVPGTAMPPWLGELDEQQIWALLREVRRLSVGEQP
ncbi:hypothetical protein C2E25_03235 [Geothermobacter hydrogeniphilus]|uniref:Cytochrome c domain-containing protein n=1 Tax=Geothermobacter hydrogeniphilus TaxID=1969733 RepID=A0A2K2HDF5_9BACT|nr:c-type cytochrome [Geothermobacter hydrogeniphilus]PNU21320.1 hypothetical protein C2E25_03235 [Geothermobacter hydrogeniphilus]